MTTRKISVKLRYIQTCKQKGYRLEALLKNYHLNIELIKFLFASVHPEHSFEQKKLKVVVREFSQELEVNPALRAVISKKTFRLVKTWFGKMDSFFKQLKNEQPDAINPLLSETEKIFAVLNISANKLLAHKQ